MKYLIYILLVAVFAFSCAKKQEEDAPANFEIKANEEASLSFLVELIDDNPRNPNNYLRLANFYFEKGELKKATSILEKAYETIPENMEVREMLLKAYWKNEELEKTASLTKEFDLERNKPGLYTSALIHFHNKDFIDALELINQAIKVDDGNADYFKLKALTLSHLGDSSDAVLAYGNAVKRENASLDMVIEYLQLLNAMESMDEFGKVYQGLAPAQKGNAEVKLVFAGALINLQQFDSAKVILNEIEENSYQGIKNKHLAEINYEQRNYDSAIYYSQISFKVNSDPETKLIEARALDKRWRYSESEETYEEILQIDSTYTIASEELEKLRRKIRYLRDLKRKEEMKIETLPSRSLEPKKPE